MKYTRKRLILCLLLSASFFTACSKSNEHLNTSIDISNDVTSNGNPNDVSATPTMTETNDDITASIPSKAADAMVGADGNNATSETSMNAPTNKPAHIITVLQHFTLMPGLDKEPILSATPAPTFAPNGPLSSTPSTGPTQNPSTNSSVSPTNTPNNTPTLEPTSTPTTKPTLIPTMKPTVVPTEKPTVTPTMKPTVVPTKKPTVTPTTKPTAVPTKKPTATPTTKPTAVPTKKPTATPTTKPTVVPTKKPTATPTTKPTVTPTPNSSDSIRVSGQSISLGSNISTVEKTLGSANRILQSEYDFSYYVYNSNYAKLLILFVKDSKIVGFYSDSIDSSFAGIDHGDSISDVNKALGTSYTMSSVISHKFGTYTLRILMDSIETSKVTGIYLLPNNASFVGYSSTVLENMNLLVLDLTNSIRVRNGLTALNWSNKAATAALNHSKDMAKNNYFSHTGLNGSSAGDRLTSAGVNWTAYGENIIGGYGNAILSTHGWFNSSGHRSNLLSTNFSSLGVGFYYLSSSNYQTYCTQNFYR